MTMETGFAYTTINGFLRMVSSGCLEKIIWEGIGYANNFLTDTENIDFEALQVPMSKAQAQAEMRVYRAYCYWYVMDMFGYGSIYEKIGEINPSSKSRASYSLGSKRVKREYFFFVRE